MGIPTGDGRILDPAGSASRDLPLPLSWQGVSGDGHGGSVVVGRIESLRFENGMVLGTGSLLDSAEWSTNVIEQLEAGVIGPSVDLDDIEYVMDEEERIVLTQWRVAGATLVSIPAFADVSLTLDPLPVYPDDVNYTDDVQVAAYEAKLAAFTSQAMEVREVTPPSPPLQWFTDPKLERVTPLTVTEEGRVFGHIAPWGQCHIGLPGCVTAPSSLSNYAYFHTGEQETRDGVAIPVGTLVAGPRHADPQLAFQAAAQHYDDPAAAVARVVAGEDAFGIWVAGWMLPGAATEAVEVFRSSPVSGDWRRVGGSLELIAVCSVNAPGFPVPRARVAFSGGVQRTFIGAFGIAPVEGSEESARTASDTYLTYDPETARARWAWASQALVEG
jgi:hypothetical protein